MEKKRRVGIPYYCNNRGSPFLGKTLNKVSVSAAGLNDRILFIIPSLLLCVKRYIDTVSTSALCLSSTKVH